ncbi:MAG: glucose-6-phosphate isomerase [Eubacteriales bacterium]|nr:glucose-6-phosphate isomerase [Eubacteriales bacterium]
MVKFDLGGAVPFLDPAGLDYASAAAAHRALTEGLGQGADSTGWLHLPKRMTGTGLKSILSAANRIRNQSEVLVVIGIGGSCLGARAAIEAIGRKPDCPEVLFAGHTLSPRALSALVEQLGDRDFSVNIISKSGTTLEPALSFRVFKSLLEKKYGRSAARRRIYATTGADNNVLKKAADDNGYETFVIPDDVGGRYSVLSAVGLLPMAAAGIDVSAVAEHAAASFRELNLRSPENPAWQYAAARQQLYRSGRTIEILACSEPSFRYMADWWKQLFGESEGKKGVGIFPASVEYPADLHAMGQYIQEGPRTLIETVVRFADPGCRFSIPFEIGDGDGLNYLSGRDFGSVSAVVTEAARAAHTLGGVPNLAITASDMAEQGFAELVTFFELSCAISGYMLHVNPFDQPGVEAYKENMYRLLRRESDND